MPRIVSFPVSVDSEGTPVVITQSAVWKTDETRSYDESLQGYRTGFRLNIDPWDLQRLIAEANRLGREGKTVPGFGYDYESHSISLTAKVVRQPEQTTPQSPKQEQ